MPYKSAERESRQVAEVSDSEESYPRELQDIIWLMAVILGWAIFLIPIWLVWSVF